METNSPTGESTTVESPTVESTTIESPTVGPTASLPSLITQASLNRLCKQAGVKTVANGCYDQIRLVIQEKLDQTMRLATIVTKQRGSKTMNIDDVYEMFTLLGENVAQSTELGLNTIGK